jgi:predicted ArsR family transcriptional regulator
LGGRGNEQPGDPLDALEALVAEQGFGPRRVEHRVRAELVLERCPYASAAEADPESVCELHRGLAEGMTSAVGHGLAVTDSLFATPRRAGWRLLMAWREGSEDRV